MNGYDVIGDVHGHLEPLETLLDRLGYRRGTGSWHHPERKALFLGDLIDRGPEQLGVLRTVRRMVDEGAADVVMGNHEYNAIGWARRGEDGRHLRVHGSRNRAQHAVFLEAVGENSDRHEEMIDWFLTFPLWIENEELRAVHACWHGPSRRSVEPWLTTTNRIDRDSIPLFFERGHPAREAAEILLKGVEVALPEGVVYRDKDGHPRSNTRVRWWDAEASTYRRAALVDEDTASFLPETPLPLEAMVAMEDGPPIFIGHYWMTGEPHLLLPSVACLDFSIAKGGFLAAYAHDGERELSIDKLSWVGRATPEEIGTFTF